MHKIHLVFKNQLEIRVELNNENCEEFFASLEERKPYFNKKNGVGFWLPPENLLYAYSKQLTSQEPCQNNPHLDQENDSLN